MTAKHRHYLAAIFGAVAFVALLAPSRAPAPKPDVPGRLDLSGMFIGPTAAEDAALISALCDELGRIIEEDGKRDPPRLKTGIQFDELRVAARDIRTRGVSIGGRQPRVRDAIEKFLTQEVGVDGGPVSPEQRAKWVDAFLEISKAAGRVTQP